ncbi:DUF418 domain-containing protein [Erythrobacter sp. LQ02-29]|uniref:DUF418 domain-containing protein n=1 Tax=Erythrobacter sp. LQ02-29 TaxID=2920384 RepID=UPI001F4DBFFF|nr:DUF418 domain-containing protein [Erythrobacter sp. LQ02-29]MCP9222412.1 DUF418 domain-containing protein [Erythrobacter sp. LQ02-29]
MTEAGDAASSHGATPDQPAVPLPAGQGDRLDNLDFIRGIAVMGILFANIISFGQPTTAQSFPDAFMVPHGPLSDVLWVVQFVLIDGKVRALFSMLFGAGMWLFLEKAWSRGQDADLQARRLFWLLAFGVLHFFFIWKGDILLLYGLCGFVLLLFLNLTARAQIVTALSIYGVGQVIYALSTVPVWYVVNSPAQGTADTLETLRGAELAAGQDAMLEANLIQHGRWGELVAHNFAQHASDPLLGFLMVGFETVPLMLIGMALYRMGLFSGAFDRRCQLGWGGAGIAVGAALSLVAGVWAWREGFTFWGTQVAMLALSHIPRLMMGVGLLAVLAVVGAGRDGWLGQRIRAAGRAAFSNYLGTSIVMMLVFHGWAGGLFGVLSRPALYGVAFATCLLMLAWSKPWLDRFRFGPLEWAWRCLTYWCRFPIRR